MGFGKCDYDLKGRKSPSLTVATKQSGGPVVIRAAPKVNAMETHSHRTDKDGKLEAEENYAAHEDDPAPSREAINEPNDRPASNTIWVALVAAIILMALIYFIFIY